MSDRCPICQAPNARGSDRCFIHHGHPVPFVAELNHALGVKGDGSKSMRKAFGVPEDDWTPSDDDAPNAPPPTNVRKGPWPRSGPGASAEALELSDQPDADLDPELLPGPAERMCREVQRTRGGPFALSGSMAAGVLSTLVQGKVRFRVSPTWTEEACLYWLVFLPASAGKSSSCQPVLKPLEDLEDEIERNVAAPRAFAMARKKGLERKLSDLGRQAANADARKTVAPSEPEELDEDSDWGIPDSPGQADMAQESMRDLSRQLASLVIPDVPRLTRADINPTMLPKRLAANQRAEQAPYGRLGILSSEPAFLRNLAGRHTKTPMLESVLSAYSGEKISEDRVGEHSGILVDSTIRRPLLSIVCQGQSKVLEDLLGVADLRDLGFFSRCIIHNLGDSASWLADGTPLAPAVTQEWAETIRAVHTWDPDPDGTGEPYELDLTPLLPVVRELLQDAERRCAARPEQTARARRAIGKALRLTGLKALFESAPWSMFPACSQANGPMFAKNTEENRSSQMFASSHSPGGWLSHRGGVFLKKAYIGLYPPDITGGRADGRTGPRTDTPTHTHTQRAPEILRTLRRCEHGPSGRENTFGPGKSWSVASLLKTLHQTDDWTRPALEELEHAGYLESDPLSIRTYRGVRAARIYRTLTLEASKPAPVPAPVPSEPEASERPSSGIGTDFIGDDLT